VLVMLSASAVARRGHQVWHVSQGSNGSVVQLKLWLWLLWHMLLLWWLWWLLCRQCCSASGARPGGQPPAPGGLQQP